jgi:hypothetical protein
VKDVDNLHNMRNGPVPQEITGDCDK